MFKESDSHHGSLGMILHRDYRTLGAKRAVRALDQDAVGKFKWTVDHKQNFMRRAIFDDRVLKKSVLGLLAAAIGRNCAGAAASVAIGWRLVRLSLIGIRTGVASGKNFAKRPTISDSSARAIAWLATKTSIPGELGSSRVPSLPGLEELRGDSVCLSVSHSARAAPKLEGHALTNKW